MAERAQPPKAQDKLAFLLSLVPYLMDHDRVSVTETANHFGVPEEQIRDAVRLIAVSGIPGETASYQHGDLFDIAWDDFDDNDQIVLTNLVAIDESPRFSAREAAALIAGLQYLSALPENADRAAIASLMSKLGRGASAAPSAVAVEATETDETVAVIRDRRRAGSRGRVRLPDLTRRPGTPHASTRCRVESVDADWYLRGWCHMREAVRTFRLDRISDLEITELPITHGVADVTLPETLFEGSDDDQLVTIDVDAGRGGADRRLHPRRRRAHRARRTRAHDRARLALPRPQAAHRQPAGRRDRRRSAGGPRGRCGVGSAAAARYSE